MVWFPTIGDWGIIRGMFNIFHFHSSCPEPHLLTIASVISLVELYQTFLTSIYCCFLSIEFFCLMVLK